MTFAKLTVKDFLYKNITAGKFGSTAKIDADFYKYL